LLDKVPTAYQGGWFDFAAAVPCWIEFQTEKPTKITLTRRQKDFKATVKPGLRYAARLLLINPEKTHASIDFPELEGFADGLDLDFARPTFPPTEVGSAEELAAVTTLLCRFAQKLNKPRRIWLEGEQLCLE